MLFWFNTYNLRQTCSKILPTGLSPRRGGFKVSLIRCSASPLTKSTSSGLVEKPWDSYNARLVLEDGSIWPAKSFAAPGTRVAELVFNTSLTGYQEILTDPSYAGQFVLMTNPQIGNTGVNLDDEESEQCFLAGLVIRSLKKMSVLCLLPSVPHEDPLNHVHLYTLTHVQHNFQSRRHVLESMYYFTSNCFLKSSTLAVQKILHPAVHLNTLAIQSLLKHLLCSALISRQRNNFISAI